jgi:hypothetical protein
MWALKVFFKQTQFDFISGFIQFHLLMTVTFAYSAGALILQSAASYPFVLQWFDVILKSATTFFLGEGGGRGGGSDKHGTQMLILIFLHVTLEIFDDICTELAWI